MTDVTMRQLLEAGVHFGHQTRFWCPKMSPYIYGHRNRIHIINLELTLGMFNDAMNYLGSVAASRGTIMFVGTKRQAGSIVEEQAKRAGCPYVYHRWLGGMLTNYRTVRKSIDRLNELDAIITGEDAKSLAKKELMQIDRERFRLNRNLAGIRDMKRIPDVLFVIDIKHENIAVLEARKLGIPVVAVVDTNCDPDGIDYVIPGNDDAISAIRLFCTYAADAVIQGKETAKSMPDSTDIVDVDSPDAGHEAVMDTVSMVGVTGAQAAVAPERVDRRFDETDAEETPEGAQVAEDAPEAPDAGEVSAEPAVAPSEDGTSSAVDDDAPAEDVAAEPASEAPAAEAAEQDGDPEPDQGAPALELSEEQEEELRKLKTKTAKIQYLDALKWDDESIAAKVESKVAFVRKALDR